jgi:hypothetical protein
MAREEAGRLAAAAAMHTGAPALSELAPLPLLREDAAAAALAKWAVVVTNTVSALPCACGTHTKNGSCCYICSAPMHPDPPCAAAPGHCHACVPRGPVLGTILEPVDHEAALLLGDVVDVPVQLAVDVDGARLLLRTTHADADAEAPAAKRARTGTEPTAGAAGAHAAPATLTLARSVASDDPLLLLLRRHEVVLVDARLVRAAAGAPLALRASVVLTAQALADTMLRDPAEVAPDAARRALLATLAPGACAPIADVDAPRRPLKNHHLSAASASAVLAPLPPLAQIPGLRPRLVRPPCPPPVAPKGCAPAGRPAVCARLHRPRAPRC